MCDFISIFVACSASPTQIITLMYYEQLEFDGLRRYTSDRLNSTSVSTHYALLSPLLRDYEYISGPSHRLPCESIPLVYKGAIPFQISSISMRPSLINFFAPSMTAGGRRRECRS